LFGLAWFAGFGKTPGKDQNMSVLIVEDNEISAELIGFHLNRNRYQTVFARNGEEAIWCMDERPEIQLVITDLNMPRMGGFELIQWMKKTPKWAVVPVVICTCHSDVGHVRQAAELGCRHYLLKPIQCAALLQKVAELLPPDRSLFWTSDQLMKKYGVDQEACARMVAKFSELVRGQHGLIQQSVQGTAELLPAIDLAGLAESAAAMGAEGLLKALKTGHNSAQDPQAVRQILTELEMLAEVLPAE